jgi:hypothetical protein
VGDIDSAGVYFLSVEEFESRSPARSRENHHDPGDPGDEGDQPEVDSTKAAITPPSFSPTSS